MKFLRNQKLRFQGVENNINLYLGKWKHIEKKGGRIFNKAQGLSSAKEVKSFNKIEYYSTMIKNYEAAQETNSFVGLKSIIKQAFVLAEKPMKDLDVEKIQEVYIKAILTRVKVEFGNYFVVPKTISGKNAFMAVKTVASGSKVFSLEEMVGTEVNKSIKELIDYKLNSGSSIKLFEGLAIENIGGDLQITMMPNILRR